MPSAADDIVAAVVAAVAEAVAAQGPLRFDQYLQLALYGQHGFYATGGVAGRRGDFLTAPEVGPLFGAVLARFVAGERRRLGEPDRFTVVEVGAGPGTLARSMRARPELAGVRYVAVEVSAAQRDRHPDGIESVGEMPTEQIDGVVVANELLDNLPFRLLVFDGGWREARVDVTRGGLVEVLAPIDGTPPDWLPASASHGARVPWQQAATDWTVAARDLVRQGTVLTFDYVTPRTAQLALEPWRQWLRTYRGHERGGHYLADPGLQDITAQVALDQLPAPDAVRTQAQFLQLWGIDQLVDEGRRAWEAAAAAPTVASLTMRSRVREAEALLEPTGLGGFLALSWQADRPRDGQGT